MSNEARNYALEALSAYQQGDVDPAGLADALAGMLDARSDEGGTVHIHNGAMTVTRCTCGVEFKHTSAGMAELQIQTHLARQA